MTHVDVILSIITVVASGLAILAALYNHHYTTTAAAEARLSKAPCTVDRTTVRAVSKLLQENLQLRGQVKDLKGLLGRLGDDHIALSKDHELGLRNNLLMLDALERLSADHGVQHKENEHVQNLFGQAAATAKQCERKAADKEKHYLASIEQERRKRHQALKERQEALMANNELFNDNARLSKQTAHLQHVLHLQRDKYKEVLQEKEHAENLLHRALAAAQNYKRVQKLYQAFTLLQKNKYSQLMTERDQAIKENKDLVTANARMMHEMAHLQDKLNTHNGKYEEVLQEKEHAQSLLDQTLAAAHEYKRAVENNEKLYLAFILMQKKKYDEVVKERDEALLANQDHAGVKDKLLDDLAQHIDEIEKKFLEIIEDVDDE